MLTIDSINVYYDRICALRDVSLSMAHGEIVTLIGSNGAGKTTLLLTLSGILKPLSGQILFEGQDLIAQDADAIVQRGIIQVPAGRGLFRRMTVEENLDVGAYLVRDKEQIETRKHDVFTYFPLLKTRREQEAGTLSGGEAQMLSIGRALMAGPRLLLLDEPSSGLAPKIVSQIFEIIQQINRHGVAVLLVEQNAAKALEISQRAYVLNVGKVVEEGPAEGLLADPAVQRAYLGQ